MRRWWHRFCRRRGLVVGENLIDTKNHVCKEQRALHRVAFTTADAPRTEEHSASDGNANEGRVNVVDFGEFCYSPEEVDRA